jgi:hypothetical protein
LIGICSSSASFCSSIFHKRARTLLEPSPPSKARALVEHRFQQAAPGTELIVEGQPRHLGAARECPQTATGPKAMHL